MPKTKHQLKTIAEIPTGDLIPNPRNAKNNDDAQVAKIAGSIREFGFGSPIITDGENGILAGHGRWLAAQKLGLETVPCVEMGHLSETQRRAYMLADNRLAEIGGGWDMDQLRIELDELSAEEIDLDLLGFGEDFDIDLDGDSGNSDADADADPQIDKAEELREKWGVETGQLWELGEHRILCGDSTKAEDVERVMGGDKPLLMVTDPPYGVSYDASWRAESISGGNVGDMATGKVENDDRADWTATWELFIQHGGAVCYIWHAGSHSPTVADSVFSAGFELRNLIVWAKDRIAISRGNYHHQHEPCWYAVKKGESAKFTEDRTQSTLWKNIQDVTRPGELIFVAKDEARKIYAIRGDRSTLWQIPKPTKSETGHSTQKPIECMARPIRNHDSEFVYEPFSGSGTTIIACEQLERKCRAIEISPAYVAVAIQRWADATGKEPKLIK